MSKRALRFGTTAEMTPGMRRLYDAQQAPPSAVPQPLPPSAVEAVAGGTRAARASKYGNSAAHVDGIRFDSRSEARYYEQLKLRVAAGAVSYFLRQVPLHMRGGTRYVVDFLEVHADGSLHYVDVKGFSTQIFKLKRREIEATYPIKIEVVK